MHFRPTVAAALLTVLSACSTLSPAERYGASHADSDELAIDIAEQVLERMGGRKAWEDTRCISWQFFGRRRHFWDKHENLSRIETDDQLILLDLDTGLGRAWKENEEVTDPEELAEILEGGRAAWINDSYWMFMPYKLLDPGVTLTYVGREETADGRDSECLQLTFSEVGITPQNAYRVRIPLETGLIEEWSFWSDATTLDQDPALTTPWTDWQAYGDIWLAGNRGRDMDWDIAVHATPPAGIFDDLVAQ